MKRTASGRKTSKSKNSSTKPPKKGLVAATAARFVVCVKSGGYVDLETLKVYKVRRDAAAKAQGLIRVEDSSGDDYLYPIEFFRAIQAPSRLFDLVERSA